MTTKNYHVIIIGSGQAGTPLAHRMAAEGKKVALIERKHIGGTCTNVGCTPTKAYVASARRMWEITNGQQMGVIIPQGSRADLKKIKERKDAIVAESVESLTSSLESNEKIHLIRGNAVFSGFKTIEVDGKRLYGDQIFINTGARASVPDVFKNVKYLTNESILELEVLPEHLIIIGGSYIGLEFAQMFRRFGSQVTVIERDNQIIPQEDNEISEAVKEILEAEGINIHLNADCTNASQDNTGMINLSLDCSNVTEQITGTHVLLAAGRTPNTDTLNLESTGITIDQRGYLPVNDHLETTVAGIYALGDCNGKSAFTHNSYNDYQIVADNLLEGEHRKVSDRIPTYCMFTDPPLARAGITKQQALDMGYNILYAYLPMESVNRAREKGETKGFLSAVIDADTLKILGASLLGSGADEVIGTILMAMHSRMPYNMVRNLMIPHPTVAELIPTMLEKTTKI